MSKSPDLGLRVWRASPLATQGASPHDISTESEPPQGERGRSPYEDRVCRHRIPALPRTFAQLTSPERAGTVEVMERSNEGFTSLLTQTRSGGFTEVHGTIGLARRQR